MKLTKIVREAHFRLKNTKLTKGLKEVEGGGREDNLNN